MADRPVVGSLAGRMYRELLPIAHVDEATGWTFLKLSQALCGPKQWVEDIGAVIPQGLSIAAQRQYIKDAPGTRRGRPEAIVAAARPFLAGDNPRITFRNRVGGSMYRQEIITFLAETPDPDGLYRAALTQKPSGHILIHTVLTGWTVDQTETDYDELTLDDLEGAFASISDLEQNLPPLETLVGGLEAAYAGQTISDLEGDVATINDLGEVG